MLINREVAFDDNGKAIVAGTAAYHYRPHTKVLELRTDHYDFVGYDVRGKTEEEIRRDNTASLD